MPSLNQQRTQKYIAARQQNAAWLLLSSRRAPLMLSCLEALFEHQREGCIHETDALKTALGFVAQLRPPADGLDRLALGPGTAQD